MADNDLQQETKIGVLVEPEPDVDIGEKERFWVGRRYFFTWAIALLLALIMLFQGVSYWITIPLFVLLLVTSPDLLTLKELMLYKRSRVREDEP